MILNDYELQTISGGGWKIAVCIGAIGIFIAGVIDGIVRPLKCH